jgi:class 3 adenylate cyclase
VECRLAAILAADVAGYSRMIGIDEEGTLSRFKAILADLFDPKIAEHRGRILKTTGTASSSSLPVLWMRCAARPSRRLE